MKFTILSSIVLAAGVIANDNGGCHDDNCARAVTGTRRGATFVSAAMADCTSAQDHTETAPAVTVTNTVTFTTTPVTPPWYATACSGLVRYSSACSCWGITASTSTFTPTSTFTTTVVVTASP